MIFIINQQQRIRIFPSIMGTIAGAQLLSILVITGGRELVLFPPLYFSLCHLEDG